MTSTRIAGNKRGDKDEEREKLKAPCISETAPRVQKIKLVAKKSVRSSPHLHPNPKPWFMSSILVFA